MGLTWIRQSRWPRGCLRTSAVTTARAIILWLKAIQRGHQWRAAINPMSLTLASRLKKPSSALKSSRMEDIELTDLTLKKMVHRKPIRFSTEGTLSPYNGVSMRTTRSKQDLVTLVDSVHNAYLPSSRRWAGRNPTLIQVVALTIREQETKAWKISKVSLPTMAPLAAIRSSLIWSPLSQYDNKLSSSARLAVRSVTWTVKES